MVKAPAEFIIQHFQAIQDPRLNRKKIHKLLDIIVLAILAVICGAEGWVDVEEFGKSRLVWLKTILELPHGIPSHDTLGRVFALLDSKLLQKAFIAFMNDLSEKTHGRVIALDGKTVRHSFDTSREKGAIHIVNAWCCKNGLTLGALKTAEKSNEIKAIPELIAALQIGGAIITIDAMGTQKAIAAQIVEKKADYVLALKKNQKQLYKDVTYLFESTQEIQKDPQFSMDYYEQKNTGHGRIETRQCWALKIPPCLLEAKGWTELNTVCKLKCTRESKGKISEETRYYISSLDNRAKELLHAVRSHWEVENKLHWTLDVVFREDDSRIRLENAVENFSLMRKMALNLLKQEPTKMSLKLKMKRAGWDNEFLKTILFG